MSKKEKSSERIFLHEIANPLAAALLAVDGVLEILKRRGADPFEIEHLSIANDSLERLKNAIRNRREVLLAEERSSSDD